MACSHWLDIRDHLTLCMPKLRRGLQKENSRLCAEKALACMLLQYGRRVQ